MSFFYHFTWPGAFAFFRVCLVVILFIVFAFGILLLFGLNIEWIRQPKENNSGCQNANQQRKV